MAWRNDNCPICRSDLERVIPSRTAPAIFVCADCGRYRIAISAYNQLMREEDAEVRVAALNDAKRQAGKAIPYIEIYNIC